MAGSFRRLLRNMRLQAERLEKANQFLVAIASHGRRFFHCEGRVARLQRGERRHLFLVDEWKGTLIYVSRHGGEWPGFHHGGTLRCVIQHLVAYVRTGEPLWAGMFDKHWGYGEAMVEVVKAGRELGVIEPPERDYDAEMRLPDGKSCADCRHVSRCVGLGCTNAENTACDFYPSRFVALEVQHA